MTDCENYVLSVTESYVEPGGGNPVDGGDVGTELSVIVGA